MKKQTYRLSGSFAALAVALAASLTTASAQTWSGATTGSASWNVGTNWSTNPTVPNASGALTTFNTLTNSLAVVADSAAATNITFGGLTLTSNQNLTLGGTAVADLGTYTLNNGASDVVFNFNNLNTDGRGVILLTGKANHITLGSNVLATNNGTGWHSLTVNSNNAAWQVDGGNKTITTQGQVSLITRGDGRPFKNVTLDLRQSTTSTTNLARPTLSFFNGSNVAVADNNKLLIGNNSATQYIRVEGPVGTFGYAMELHGNVRIDKVNANGNFPNIEGQITDMNATAKLTLVNTDSANRTAQISGALANTYRGGTEVNFNWTNAATGNSRLLLNKDNALGTGALSFGNNTTLVSLNVANNTIGGLQNGGVSSDQVGRTGGAIIREDSTAAGAPTLVTLDLKDTGTSVFGGSIGTTSLAISGTNMTVARQNNIAVVKSGTGTQTLTGESYYTGGTTVSGGTLLINNTTGSGTGTGAVSVTSGKLGGTGSISGNVSVTGGTFSPGASIETIGTGALSFGNGTTFEYEVNSGVAPSVGADLVKVTGNLTFSGTVTLTLANLSVGSFADNTTFSLVNYTGTWNGGFLTYESVSLADGAQFTFNGQDWTIDYNATSGGVNFSGEYVSGNFVNITAIPEPTTWALLAGSLTAIMVLRRRRRA